MSRQPTEIKSIIDEMEHLGFDLLRTKANELLDQVHLADAYALRLLQGLDPSIKPKVAYPSRRVDHAVNLLASTLRISMGWHCEPTTGKKRDDTRADDVELYHANSWATHLDPNGLLRSMAWRSQVVQPFEAWWLDHMPYDQGERKGQELKDYQETYFPAELFRCGFGTVYFLDRDDGTVTSVARHYNLTYLEILERYAGKERKVDGPNDNALTLFGEKYGWLRAGRGEPMDAAELARHKAEVWVLDDGRTCTHAARGLGKDNQTGEGECRNLTLDDEDYPNMWGRPALFLIPGNFNPDGRTVVERYSPLIRSLAREQETIDRLNSTIASIGLAPTRWLIEPSEASLGAVAAGDIPAEALGKIEFGDTNVAVAHGKVTELRQQIAPEVRELLVQATASRDALWPSPWLTGISEETAKASTAAAILDAHQTADKVNDNARQYILAAVREIGLALEYCAKKKTTAPAFYSRLRGGLNVTKWAGDRKGELLALTGEDFDFPHTLEVKPIAITDSQRQLRYQLVRQQVQDKTATPEQLIETLTEDVQGQVEKLEIVRRFQERGPLMDTMGMIASVEAVKMATGRDYSRIFLMSQGAGAPPPAPGPGADGGGGFGAGRTDAPVEPLSAVEVG